MIKIILSFALTELGVQLSLGMIIEVEMLTPIHKRSILVVAMSGPSMEQKLVQINLFLEFVAMEMVEQFLDYLMAMFSAKKSIQVETLNGLM